MVVPTTKPTSNPLTLIMPIREDVELNTLLGLIDASFQAVLKALDEIETVHYARFVILDLSSPNLHPSPGSRGPFKLAVITTYDFEFDRYIRDFVVSLADVFDVLVDLTIDGGVVTPVRENVDAFIEWVRKNDAAQQFPHQDGPSQYCAYPFDVQTIKTKCKT